MKVTVTSEHGLLGALHTLFLRHSNYLCVLARKYGGKQAETCLDGILSQIFPGMATNEALGNAYRDQRNPAYNALADSYMADNARDLDTFDAYRLAFIDYALRRPDKVLPAPVDIDV